MVASIAEDGLLIEESVELRAGQVVPAGCYVRTDVPSGRRVILERAGPLPASLDGRVAVYERIADLSRALASLEGGRRFSVVEID